MYFFHIVSHQDTLQIGKDRETLRDLEVRFGMEIPWNDVRLSARTTQLSQKVSRALPTDDGNQAKYVTCPGFSAIQDGSLTKNPSEVQKLLDSLLKLIDPNFHTEGETLVQSLRDCLRLPCGRVRRSSGGWQYADSFMLDCVLFADNLRPLHDGDLMQDSVKQFLGTVI